MKHFSDEPGQTGADRSKDIEMFAPEIQQETPDKEALFLEQSGNQPYVHINEGYVVVVKMSGEADAADILREYLKKRMTQME